MKTEVRLLGLTPHGSPVPAASLVPGQCVSLVSSVYTVGPGEFRVRYAEVYKLCATTKAVPRGRTGKDCTRVKSDRTGWIDPPDMYMPDTSAGSGLPVLLYLVEDPFAGEVPGAHSWDDGREYLVLTTAQWESVGRPRAAHTKQEFLHGTKDRWPEHIRDSCLAGHVAQWSWKNAGTPTFLQGWAIVRRADIDAKYLTGAIASPVKRDNPHPHKCRCGSPAYVGYTYVECTRKGCHGYPP